MHKQKWLDIAQICECLGAGTTEKMIIDAFSGMSANQIRRVLDFMFPDHDNIDLATSIYNLVR